MRIPWPGLQATGQFVVERAVCCSSFGERLTLDHLERREQVFAPGVGISGIHRHAPTIRVDARVHKRRRNLCDKRVFRGDGTGLHTVVQAP